MAAPRGGDGGAPANNDTFSSSSSSNHPPSLLDRMADAASAVLRVAASAGELIADRDLRRRGAAIVRDEAARGLQRGLEGLERGANLGVAQVEALLSDVERRVSSFQREQQQHLHLARGGGGGGRGGAAMDPAEARRAPVDVQVGDGVFEDAPQEMRARLLVVLSKPAHADLADALGVSE